MFNISKNKLITTVVGDSFSFSLSEIYDKEIESGDCIYFRVMPAECSWEDAPIKKEYTEADMDEENNIIISFDSEDTINLIPATYYYEVKIINEESGDVNTIITRRRFILLS